MKLALRKMPLFHDNDPGPEEIIDTICVGCDLPARTNDLGLCRNCAAKLERDLIRSRDWDHSITAFGVEPEKLEALRERVIQEYGANDELIPPLGTPLKTPRKNKRSHSRATQHKRKIAAHAQRNYSTEDVLQAAQDFLRCQLDSIPENRFCYISRIKHLTGFCRNHPCHKGGIPPVK